MTGGDQGRYVIDGRFELSQRLGGGGMGLVWRARDLMLQREVALKEVRSPDPSVHGSDPAGQRIVRERVLREAQALARLQHPNVVTIYHIVDSPDLAHPWLVMELVSGGSLDSLLDERDLTVPEAVRIGRGVLGALRAAHAAGIQHRDVKPANVLLREDGTPVLTDFGIAALEASPGLTATGMLIGSPEYMAPERVHGIEGDPSSDLWSLCLMLYVGLEGRNPLSRDSTIATIAAVSGGYVPPPVRSGALGPVLSAVLVPDPARRPTAEQLDAMLAQVEAGRSVTGLQAQVPGNFAGGTGYTNWQQTIQYGGTGQMPVTDQMAGYAGHPPVNPYGNTSTSYPAGMSPEATERYRSKAFRLTTMSTVAVLAVMGISVWATTRAQSHGNRTGGADPANSSPAFSMPSFSDPVAVAGSSPPSQSSTTATAASAGGGSSTATQHLLTPAGVRAVIKQIFAVSGSNRVVSMTVYDDHASFDVVKKDDPKVYDTYDYSNGKAAFSMTGSTLDEGEPALDPYTVNWDALPGLLKDANSSLNVKNPNYHYVVVDSDIIDHTLGLRVYVGDDYRSGYLSADLKGKILERYPQE
ncbi:serine/threonine protein kinase [Catenulispora acidiphila DSM 44928]|uniref:non-specific serine/threonine protein kinase n=1 Tax=Catenulispora acidiphila (strain DSM 44928 / JCM 14897 / NBRC 102108 / NRRL B-24433 / ID139908) TaxID=479433 RepID=C7Q1D0_CATAD|nr:serine/threonine-protein kinase [Catenulispora acidiphila]ACU73659.1 serine/threonine protein kinase [Catenulispora acidiphila DSM 44928]